MPHNFMPRDTVKFVTFAAGLLIVAQIPMAMAKDIANPPAAVVATEPGAAELAASAELLDVIMPPAQRQAMADNMIQSMMQNMTSGIVQSPQLQDAFKQYPAMQDIFKKFITREEAKALDLMQENMPSMIKAMTRAYARRFTVEQLEEMSIFFASPTGQIYVAESMAIMSDPDVARWQSDVMQKSMADMPIAMEQLMTELMAVTKETAAE